MKGQHLPFTKGDSDRINAILKAMLDKVQDNFGKVSPLMGRLDTYSKTHDELLVGFSIVAAREGGLVVRSGAEPKSRRYL